ncbi:alpha-crystallin B chain-like [Limulus polyphemus]|uniref:Alpha-crystallin B chain-like n=1 Tax=Limulus polyphemus TaxID=6850 RepID=A0ABM1BTQ7_LIMPO|nr:alpha-crystallin B chain-like [Limulus polyphemus]XP_013788477.1 alpha-crystallin B chain-like [Limulus polyphemus]XP_013788478.1 alpha-crystallin B chain-like [Limulus polyphemus]
MASSERKVPIRKTDSHIIDQEFSSIRERFEAEMKRMEDEMSRFRSQLMDRERNSVSSSQSHRTSTMHSSKSTNEGTAHKSEFKSWLDGLDSPLIHEGEDGKELKLRFDVSQYAPEEIVVKTVDNRLQVHAKHEEKSECRQVFREYNREFLLPKGTNPEMIKSSLSKDGVLTIEAPLPVVEGSKERLIPIEKA